MTPTTEVEVSERAVLLPIIHWVGAGGHELP